MTNNNDKDQRFLSRIRGYIATVEAWDADPLLLAECRLMIPFEQLMPELYGRNEASPYHRDDDFLYQGNALFLKRLALFFQTNAMTWINAPPCRTCNSTEEMEERQGRGPETAEEREGQANRVEVYHCKACNGSSSGNNSNNTTTTFPRYNSVRKLLETRKGRCGEYANVFGLYCRAAGFETRYVMDWTDHVWIEALVGDEWIMADSCEGAISRPSMYESGWGKKLNYTVGITKDAVVDVTPRYTRNFHDPEFQRRRRTITSSEGAGEQAIVQCNASLRQALTKSRVEELDRRAKLESKILATCKSTKEWTEEEKHGRGRISGSLEWKASRHEEGKSQEEAEPSIVRSLYIEQFYPTGALKITVLPQSQAGILVAGANCDVEQPECISAVVVDDAHLGCVLACRSFASWSDLGDFIATIPSGRIVAMKGRVPEETLSRSTKVNMSLLGGFRLPKKQEDGVIFVGQVEAHPDWTECSSFSGSSGLSVEFSLKKISAQKLRTERDTAPSKITTRLPESVMPLQTQLLANETQKRAAFLSFSKEESNYIGYTTTGGCPVYLLENSSFPFRRMDGWNTFHFLPENLVSENNGGVVDSAAKSSSEGPKFDIPLEKSFFTSLLGPHLLQGIDTNSVVPASDALCNTRLVGLYFSAHWCPPCRRFTPMLIEAYNHLKEDFPSHGLEMVFVSSDRSSSEFSEYYASMPWASVPYQDRAKQQDISKRYGVRGIPALVILDAMSGQIVASTEQSRNEVLHACQRGDDGIQAMLQSWLNRIPDDSKELMSILELSCENDGGGGADDERTSTDRAAEHSYLIRNLKEDARKNVELFDTRNKVKEVFTKLVSKGEAPNSTAANAIRLVGDMPQNGSYSKGMLTSGVRKADVSGNNDVASQAVVGVSRFKERNSVGALQQLLNILIKFLGNAVREPWNPKLRNMKLSNKVVDRVATRMEYGLDVAERFGLTVMVTSQDYFVTIPLAADPDRIRESVSKALKMLVEEGPQHG